MSEEKQTYPTFFESIPKLAVSIKPDLVPGLRAELRKGIQGGQPYEYVVFLQPDNLIKWKIIAVMTHNGRVQSQYVGSALGLSLAGRKCLGDSARVPRRRP